jgi:hypothetical protein
MVCSHICLVCLDNLIRARTSAGHQCVLICADELMNYNNHMVGTAKWFHVLTQPCCCTDPGTTSRNTAPVNHNVNKAHNNNGGVATIRDRIQYTS